MNATCLFCHSRLERNELIETFPIGRRLAFDLVKGRLWVVCRGCDGWNLTPLEERWEALEQCEKLFRATKLRASTPNIGLAHVSDYLELVRIGEPLRPELAIWRYGRRLRQRRWRAFLSQVRYAGPLTAKRMAIPIGATGILVVAVPILLPSLGLVAMTAAQMVPQYAMQLWTQALMNRIAFRTTLAGRQMTIRAHHLHGLVFRLRESGWRLEVPADEGKVEVEMDEGLGILARSLPLVNDFVTSSRAVRAATASIETAGSVAEYVRSLPDVGRALGHRYTPLNRYPRELRLGLEIAAQEEFERQALEADLRALEKAWHEAEEIAAIADTLLIPPWIEEWLENQRRRTGASTSIIIRPRP